MLAERAPRPRTHPGRARRGRPRPIHEVLSPFLNFHRPCLFPETRTDSKGKTRRNYPAALVAAPYEALKRLPDAEPFLKPGVTFAQLDAGAHAEADIEAAERVTRERGELFRKLFSGRAA